MADHNKISCRIRKYLYNELSSFYRKTNETGKTKLKKLMALETGIVAIPAHRTIRNKDKVSVPIMNRFSAV